MPTYFQMLRSAQLDQVFGSSFMTYLQGAGLLGTLALAFVVLGFLFILTGGSSRWRRVNVLGFSLAIVAAVLGWAGSYLGYLSAVRIVKASSTTPTAAELVSGANHMAWTALVPTVGMLIVLVIGALIAGIRGKGAGDLTD